jgi:hypothetical protein
MVPSISMVRNGFIFKVNWSREKGKNFLGYLTMIRKTLRSFVMLGTIYPTIRCYITVGFCVLLTVLPSRYNSCKWPTWRKILIHLFHFSTCFEQPHAHHQENQLYEYNIWYMSLCVGDRLVQCFSTNGPRSSTGLWHELYRAARGSPGTCHFSLLSIFHE